jgi:pentachlorophenol monooxygenase
VGCDGAHSTVSHQLGLEFEGIGHPEVFLVLDARLEGPFEHDKQHFVLTDTATLTALPLPGQDRFAVTMQDLNAHVETDHGVEPVHLSVQELEERMAFAGLGLKLAEVRWMSRYRVSTRLASRYRVGRVFLAGDAAHIQSPKGSFGMNLGLLDAFNLGWKLASGSERWLGTYEPERRPVAHQLGQLSDVLFSEQEEHHPGPEVHLRSAFEERVELVEGDFGPGWTWRGGGPALPLSVRRLPSLSGGLVRPDGQPAGKTS